MSSTGPLDALQIPVRYAGAVTFDDVPVDTDAIGVVVPFDFELDWEYWKYLPSRVELFFTRTPYIHAPVGLEMARACGRPSVVAKGIKALGAVRPASTLYACTSGSFVDGLAGEQAIRQAMEQAGARRAVTSSGAALQALEAVGARRISVVTPYTKGVTVKLVSFLAEAGIETVRASYLGLNGAISRVSQATVADLVRSAAHPDAEAVFVSCTALRTFGMVAELERELGIPILTSNQVSLWAALRDADILPRAAREEGWVMGGGDPMSRSTALLLAAAGALPSRGSLRRGRREQRTEPTVVHAPSAQP
jgi:maleate isomerase